MSDTLITIRLQANQASILVSSNGLGKIGQVENYQQPSDLLPELTRLLTELPDLRLPDIQTSSQDTVKFYQGYDNWQADDTQWGFNQADYQQPKPAKKKSEKSKPKYQPKTPFTLEQAGKQRTLLMTDDFDVQLQQKDNKKFKFNDLKQAEQIASVLATQDKMNIKIKDKAGKTVSTVKPESKRKQA